MVSLTLCVCLQCVCILELCISALIWIRRMLLYVVQSRTPCPSALLSLKQFRLVMQSGSLNEAVSKLAKSYHRQCSWLKPLPVVKVSELQVLAASNPALDLAPLMLANVGYSVTSALERLPSPVRGEDHRNACTDYFLPVLGQLP